MTQKEKQLLLQDLCARLSHGVKVWYKYYTTNIIEEFATSIRLADDKIALSSKITKEGDWYPIEEAGEILIKPYLRPMSSMTEDEKDELYAIIDWVAAFDEAGNLIIEDYVSGINLDTINKYIDWLNEHHFDYRHLISMGLALPATEDMYK